MSEHSDFGEAIHTEQWWAEDSAEADAQLALFREIPTAEYTPEVAAKLASLVLQELVQLRVVVKTMAMETPKPKRGRPRKAKSSET